MNLKKRLVNTIIIVIALISVLTSLVVYTDSQVVMASNSTSEIVMEVNTNRVIHQNNAKDKKYMASTTKILTAITVIENCDLDEIVTVKKETVGIEGSSIYLKEGEKLTVLDLLYGLMLRSGNDCAETLAVHCSKSIENFARLMNETAQKIGAENSNFVNPHGLHNDNHYTTAYDLALISCYAMKNESFKEIVCTKKITITNQNDNYRRVLINKNKMLNEFEGSTGIKTGFTKKAGRCLVTSCVRNGLELVCVVLNCPPMFERSKTLLQNSFDNYQNYKIVESDNIFDFLEVEDSDTKCGVMIEKDIIIPLTKSEYENIKIVKDYPQKIKKGIKKGSTIGFVKIYCANNLIFTEKIYTIIDTD